MLNLENIYKNIRVAPATVFGGLAIYPLITKNAVTRDYLTLSEAFEVSAWTDQDEIMAIRHRSLPLEGVQFHPESFLTTEGTTLLANFLRL